MLIKNAEQYIKNPKAAIHVGGHDGGERFWYNTVGFSQVFWFEPNKVLFERLKQNLQPYLNQIAFNLGVHDTLTEATLHLSNNDGESSSILELGLHKTFHPKVHYVGEQKIRLVRLDEWFDRAGINLSRFNFLNIDVQGVELNVIKSLGKKIDCFDYIYTEINEDYLYEGCALVGEIDAYLSEFGFERKATHMTKNKWGDALYIKK
jgi:FkbM family methyltransferase